MNELQKEFVEKFCDEEGDYLNEYVPTDTVWLWIEQKLKEAEQKAKIEENQKWIDMINDGFGYKGAIHCIRFQRRISELKGE